MWSRSVDVWGRWSHFVGWLNIKRWHYLVLKHGEVNGAWYGAAALAFVALRAHSTRVHWSDAPLFLEHADMRGRGEIGL